MSPKTDYVTQLKELKDLSETTNTNIKFLENRITTNHEELMAMLKHKQRKPLTFPEKKKSL